MRHSTLAAALLCGTVALTSGAFAAGMSANTNIGSVVSTQTGYAGSNTATTEDSNADTDMTTNESDNDMDSDATASSASDERATTRELNQRQASGYGVSHEPSRHAGVSGRGARQLGKRAGVASHASVNLGHTNASAESTDQEDKGE